MEIESTGRQSVGSTLSTSSNLLDLLVVQKTVPKQQDIGWEKPIFSIVLLSHWLSVPTRGRFFEPLHAHFVRCRHAHFKWDEGVKNALKMLVFSHTDLLLSRFLCFIPTLAIF
jgi:hypothetical protein